MFKILQTNFTGSVRLHMTSQLPARLVNLYADQRQQSYRESFPPHYYLPNPMHQSKSPPMPWELLPTIPAFYVQHTVTTYPFGAKASNEIPAAKTLNIAKQGWDNEMAGIYSIISHNVGHHRYPPDSW